MSQQFKIGDRVSLKAFGAAIRIIIKERDGQFILTDEYGAPKGGAWASDLQHA